MSQFEFKEDNLQRSSYTSKETEIFKSKKVNINTLLNRVRTNKKKEKFNKITLLSLSSLSFLIIGLIVF